MRRRVAVQMLAHERSTTAGAVLGVVAIVFLVGQQLAVLFGLLTLMSALIDNSGADIWVVPRNVNNTNSTGTLPIRYVDRLMALDEIEWAEPVIYAGAQLRLADGTSRPVQVVGCARPRLAGGPWQFAQGTGSLLLAYGNVTIDRLDLAELGNPQLDQIVEVNSRRVRIAGFTSGARAFGAPLVFASLAKARELVRLPDDRCSNILVRLRSGTNLSRALELIRAVLPKAEALTVGELAVNTKVYNLTRTGIGSSFGFSTVIGVLVGVVIITLTMYTNVLNRQRDFAVLRALGARARDVFLIILFQALTIGLVGIIIGFLLLAGFLLGVQGSRLPANLPYWVPVVHVLLTFLLCIAGSAIALRRALRIEPAAAFR